MILEDRCGRLSCCPQNWLKIENGIEIIFWPKKNISNLQKDANSMPICEGEDKWITVTDTIKRRNIMRYEDAEAELERMMETDPTDTDGEHNTGEISQHKIRKIPSKGYLKEVGNTQVPRYDVPSSITQTAPNSFLMNRVISTVSQSSSMPNTPVTSKQRVSIFESPNTTPSSFLTYPGMSPLFEHLNSHSDVLNQQVNTKTHNIFEFNFLYKKLHFLNIFLGIHY